jgi:3-deoxy-D-manno-octulosonic-acid transferase
MFLIYNLLLTLFSPFWVPWMLLKSRRRKERPNWSERQGRFDIPPRGEKHRIWVHTVSVGEFVAATPILREIRKALPNHEILVSVTTSSGHQTAREAEPGLFDHLVYFPIDVARFQLAAMQQVRPDVVAIMETELWMNFVWAAKTFGARTLLVNGRISDKHFPTSLRLRSFYKVLLKDVDLCLMQSEVDMERIKALGAREARVVGNCKFDQAIQELRTDPGEWRHELGLDPMKFTIVVGSTRGEEEELFVLRALATVGFEKLNVIHAPRHLERVEALSEEVMQQTGAVALRSRHEVGPYLILDTYGELSSVYAVAEVVIVGGGFENLGGQNIIQPLAHSKPVLHGPHMQNFRDVAAMADDAGAAQVCETPEVLAKAIQSLLEDSALREQMGEQAKQLVQRNLGASRRYAKVIAEEAVKAK